MSLEFCSSFNKAYTRDLVVLVLPTNCQFVVIRSSVLANVIRPIVLVLSTSHILWPRAAMRWPLSTSSPNKDDRDVKPLVSWSDNLNATDWSHYTEPRTVIPSVLLTLATLATIRVYKRYLRRIPDTKHIKPDLFRRRSLFGTVTSVGDGDNFRLFHTPGGRLGGWGWLPNRTVPTKRGDLVAKTVRTSP